MKIGDHVLCRHGFTGRIDEITGSFYSHYEATSIREFVSIGLNPEPADEWLSQQSIPFTDEQLKEAWATVLCDGGGSIISPLSLLTIIPPLGAEHKGE